MVSSPLLFPVGGLVHATSVILSQSRTLNIYDLLVLLLAPVQCQLTVFLTCFLSFLTMTMAGLRQPEH
jgi:hypothetical protein